jgi:hypothetical protein
MSLVVWNPALCLASHAEALPFKYAGARYHVMSRGDPREAIFYDDADRVEFLRTLAQACLKTDRLRIGSASYDSNLLSSVDSKLSPPFVYSDAFEMRLDAKPLKQAAQWVEESENSGKARSLEPVSPIFPIQITHRPRSTSNAWRWHTLRNLTADYRIGPYS